MVFNRDEAAASSTRELTEMVKSFQSFQKYNYKLTVWSFFKINPAKIYKESIFFFFWLKSAVFILGTPLL